MGAVPCCLLSGHRVIRQVDSGLECESLIEEIVGGLSFVLVGLYWQSMLLGGGLLLRKGVSGDKGGRKPRQGDSNMLLCDICM